MHELNMFQKDNTDVCVGVCGADCWDNNLQTRSSNESALHQFPTALLFLIALVCRRAWALRLVWSGRCVKDAGLSMNISRTLWPHPPRHLHTARKELTPHPAFNYSNLMLTLIIQTTIHLRWISKKHQSFW